MRKNENEKKKIPKDSLVKDEMEELNRGDM